MVDIEEYLEGRVEAMVNERGDFASGSKEKVQHDSNVSAMVKSIVDLKRLETEQSIEEMKIENDRTKTEAQLNHDEKWKAEEMNQRIVEHKSDVELKEAQAKHERKAKWVGLGLAAASAASSVILHVVARSDAREGIAYDDRQKFMDRNKVINSITSFFR